MEFIGSRRVPSGAAVSQISEIRKSIEKRRSRTKGRDTFSQGWSQLAKRRREKSNDHTERGDRFSWKRTLAATDEIIFARSRRLPSDVDRASVSWSPRRKFRRVASISIESELRRKRRRRASKRIERTSVEFADRANGCAFSPRVFDS
jgi:hypothetical protein